MLLFTYSNNKFMNSIYRYFCIVSIFTLSGCASIINGRYARIYVSSNYPDAKIEYHSGHSSPVTIEGARSYISVDKKDLNSAYLLVTKKGCRPNSELIAGTFDPMFLLNLIPPFFLVGFIVDFSTGAVHNSAKTHYVIDPICKV